MSGFVDHSSSRLRRIARRPAVEIRGVSSVYFGISALQTNSLAHGTSSAASWLRISCSGRWSANTDVSDAMPPSLWARSWASICCAGAMPASNLVTKAHTLLGLEGPHATAHLVAAKTLGGDLPHSEVSQPVTSRLFRETDIPCKIVNPCTFRESPCARLDRPPAPLIVSCPIRALHRNRNPPPS